MIFGLLILIFFSTYFCGLLVFVDNNNNSLTQKNKTLSDKSVKFIKIFNNLSHFFFVIGK